MGEFCDTCTYIWPATNECRRYPPTVVLEGANLRSAWPIVTADDTCGEYQPGGSPPSGGITLTSLSPNTLPAGSTPASVDVYGTGFDSTCTVDADGAPRTTFYIDATHLQYTARPDLQPGPDTVQITVIGAGGTSNALTFTYT